MQIEGSFKKKAIINVREIQYIHTKQELDAHQKIYKQQMLERVWRKGNPLALLVGM